MSRLTESHSVNPKFGQYGSYAGNNHSVPHHAYMYHNFNNLILCFHECKFPWIFYILFIGMKELLKRCANIHTIISMNFLSLFNYHYWPVSSFYFPFNNDFTFVFFPIFSIVSHLSTLNSSLSFTRSRPK